MSGEVLNLDILAAEVGRRLSEKIKDEKVLNHALAVLEEQGPYAMFLFVRARHAEHREPFERELVELLRQVLRKNAEEALEIAKNVANDLDNLLFARDLLRTALIYARFHLKAKGGE